MHKSYLIFISLFFSTLIMAQDTTFVQTFTWDSDTRRETFTFPDDPSKTYRKIYMKYHMRCHDAAVGNGAVGCREWDYSCNTFVTDPSATDSLRSFHPDYIIPGYDELILDYLNSPVYDYYIYELAENSLSANNPIISTIGDGSESLSISTDNNIGRNQTIYTADELQAAGAEAGPIYGIQLFANAADGVADFLKIKMAAVSINDFAAASPIEDGLMTVYYHHTSFQNGWNELAFQTPFEWDGTSNILIETSFSSKENTATLELAGTSTDASQSINSSTENAVMNCVGSNSMQIPTDALSTIENEVTVAFWAKGDKDKLPSNTFVFNGQDANNGRQISSHLPWSDGSIYWDCAGDRVSGGADASEYAGQWNHYAFVKNATTGTQTIYINGEVFASGEDRNQTIQEVTRFIVGNIWSYDRPYYGLVDEFQLWDKALDQTTIQEWMRQSVDASHPNYDNLLSYYPFNEGQGADVSDASQQANHTIMNGPYWKQLKGEELYNNFTSFTSKANIQLMQGDYTITTEAYTETDSVLIPQYEVINYGLDGTDIVELGRINVYPAGYSYVYDEFGNKLDSIYHQPEDGVGIQELTYYQKFDAKYELLSLVTPYGNGLDLGPEGKIFMFDVTDFTHILKGDKQLSIEFGGEWQEELDIEFIYIEGTPERDVISLQNIWPMRRAWFDQIQSDVFNEPRTIQLNPNASHYNVRSSITGHGQNGEFTPRQHYVNVNGGQQEYMFNVWKECGFNPIYPQGGTWIFDRAGWCPGMETDLRRLNITDHVNVGDEITIDYGLNGNWMDAANYLVSHQLVSYGDYNFNLDASIESVIRPNNQRVEYERLNPSCNTPTIKIRNSGASEITSLEIQYGVRDHITKVYNWEGSIMPLTEKDIEIAIFDLDFWDAPTGENFFDVELLSVNGQKDDQPDNDLMTSTFDNVDIFEFEGTMSIRVLTNNVASDNSYTLTDAGGNVVMERTGMSNNTEYLDLLNVASGCYTLNFNDSSHDGLYFWFFGGNGQGALSISEELVNDIYVPVKSFLSDHGGGVQFDFVVINDMTNTDDLSPERVSIYPNPAKDILNIEVADFKEGLYHLSLTNLQGQKVISTTAELLSSDHISLDVSNVITGTYFLQIQSKDARWNQKLEISK